MRISINCFLGEKILREKVDEIGGEGSVKQIFLGLNLLGNVLGNFWSDEMQI